MKKICIGIFAVALAVQAWAAPANDDFASAELITGSSATVTANNSTATEELLIGEPNHAAKPPLNSVWWTWTAPVTGLVEVDTFGSSIDTVLAVYTGTVLSNLTAIASHDDTMTNSQSRVEINATNGVVYKIAVDSYAPAGAITLNITGPVLPPSNDSFAGRESVTGFPATVTGSNVNASAEGADEPDHAGETAEVSVWWTWTASETEDVAISTEGSAFDTILAVYTGGVLTSLVEVASNDDDGTNISSRVVLSVSSGVTYQVAVDGSGGANGDISLSFSEAFPSPSNDDFADRETVTGVPATATGSSVGAGAEVGEPAHHASAATESIWWTWTAPSTGTFNIDTFGSSYDTRLAVYTGTVLSNLTGVASNDDFGVGAQSKVTFTATSGVTYQIAVDGFESAVGDVTLNVTAGPAGPANDLFVDAVTLSVFPGTVTGDNNNATAEVGEPSHFTPIPAQSSAWWKWVAPSNGLVSVDTFGSSYDTLLAVYTGGSVSTLTQLASGNKSGLVDQSRVAFNAQAGVTYYIAVDGQFGAEGSITLTIKPLDGGTITDYSLIGGGFISLTWKSESGEEYQIYDSTNLVAWSSIASLAATTTVSTIVVPTPAASDVAYYRVQIDL